MAEKRHNGHQPNLGQKVQQMSKAAGWGIDQRIRDWYIATFPTDDLGSSLKESTFRDLIERMNRGIDVSITLGSEDSTVRERVFDRTSELLQVDYDVVYCKWLRGTQTPDIEFPAQNSGQQRGRKMGGIAMHSVFRVELSGGNSRYCELSLPATDYELLDAMDQLQKSLGDDVNWEFLEHNGFEYLDSHLQDECSLYELNALSKRLADMSFFEQAAFEGLVKMEVAKKDGLITPQKFIDLAYNTDCCHVVAEAHTDTQLGRFYAEGGFLEEVYDLPDKVFEMLDFERIGRENRTAENGVFTQRGYVVCPSNAEQKAVYETLNLIPKRPDYIFLLEISRFPFENETEERERAVLKLPATEECLHDALVQVNAAAWDEVVFEIKDSAIPELSEALDGTDGIRKLCELSECIKKLNDNGLLTKYKAVIHANECQDIEEAIQLAVDIDDYAFDDTIRTPEDVALDDLHAAMSEEDIAILLPHLNRFGYGQAVMERLRMEMTPYGLIAREDGQPIKSQCVEYNSPEMT